MVGSIDDSRVRKCSSAPRRKRRVGAVEWTGRSAMLVRISPQAGERERDRPRSQASRRHPAFRRSITRHSGDGFSNSPSGKLLGHGKPIDANENGERRSVLFSSSRLAHVKRLLGPALLPDLTETAIRAYIKTRLEEGAGGRPLPVPRFLSRMRGRGQDQGTAGRGGRHESRPPGRAE